ncbi:hypothetical protein NPIL_423991, partial [Nephila pilipes]
ETSDGTTAALSKEDRNPSERIRNLDERRNEEMFPKRGATWNFLKGLVLILCISSVFVNRMYFCTEYPHLCNKPSNVTQFCEKYPFNCICDSSNLML